jgi:hypothetical protein
MVSVRDADRGAPAGAGALEASPPIVGDQGDIEEVAELVLE